MGGVARKMGVEPSRGEQCLSDLQLDELLADTANDVSRAFHSRHLSSCRRCVSRFREISHEREVFASGSMPGFLHSGRRKRSYWSRHGGKTAATLAMAAALLMWLSPGGKDGGAVGDGEHVRKKGAVFLSLQVKRGSQTFVAERGENLFAGDVVQFVVPGDVGSYVAVFNIEADGTIEPLFPVAGRGAALVPNSAEDRVLDVAVELDESKGEEEILAVYCDEPFDIDRASVELAQNGGALPHLASPQGGGVGSCEIATVSIVKGDAPL